MSNYKPKNKQVQSVMKRFWNWVSNNIQNPSPQKGKKHKRIPTDDELLDFWTKNHPDTKFGLGFFRRYGEGVWPVVEDSIIEKEILEILIIEKRNKVRPTHSRVSSVRSLARANLFVLTSDWDSRSDLLPCRNGVLDVNSCQLLPHDPGYYFTSGFDFDYDPNAQCPMFQDALETTIPEEKEFFQEFSGYALTPDTSLETAIWFYGPPGSGKSTIVSGLQAMLGSRCGILGLADIEKSRFALTNIIGKTLLVATEIPRTSITTSHILNSLISGEPMEIDRKFKDPIEIIPHAKLIWAMNDLPDIKSINNGLFRRVKIIRFPPLPANQQNTKLKSAISQERSGILNWALEGLIRLRSRGYFSFPNSVIDATNQFQLASDVAAEFVSEMCVTGPGFREKAGHLYSAYRSWCYRNGYKPESNNRMAEEWKRLGFHRVTSGGYRYWEGVKIKLIP